MKEMEMEIIFQFTVESYIGDFIEQNTE